MGLFHFMQGFLSSGTLGFHCTENTLALVTHMPMVSLRFGLLKIISHTSSDFSVYIIWNFITRLRHSQEMDSINLWCVENELHIRSKYKTKHTIGRNRIVFFDHFGR